jgi:hypothetical protein
VRTKVDETKTNHGKVKRTKIDKPKEVDKDEAGDDDGKILSPKVKKTYIEGAKIHK